MERSSESGRLNAHEWTLLTRLIEAPRSAAGRSAANERLFVRSSAGQLSGLSGAAGASTGPSELAAIKAGFCLLNSVRAAPSSRPSGNGRRPQR